MIETEFLLKYTTDELLGLILLIISSPLMLIVALAIWLEGLFVKTSRGPVVYKEVRISKGEPLVCISLGP